MSKPINLGDRDTHIESVIKSNLVGFSLSSVDIDFIVFNMTADILHALESYDVASDNNNNNEEE